MTPDSARELVVRAITDVAPDIDPTTIDPDVPLQEQLDLDSMDYLQFLDNLSEASGTEIPERDYPQIQTLAGTVDYLVAVVPG